MAPDKALLLHATFGLIIFSTITRQEKVNQVESLLDHLHVCQMKSKLTFPFITAEISGVNK